MSRPRFIYWAEGPTDRAVARAVLTAAGAEPGDEFASRRSTHAGKQALIAKLAGLNAAAAYQPVLILRDLDQDAQCPGGLAQQLLPRPGRLMILRIVVRSCEAWLMADHEAFATWIGVAPDRVMTAPELSVDGKAAVVDLCRRSTNRDRKRDILPRDGERVGQGYTFALTEFVNNHWNPKRAASTKRAPSLAKALERIAELR